MKKKLLAVAVVGALAAPAAFAQTLYGIVDVGYQNSKYSDGDVNKNFIQSGQHSGSRFGVRGSEDLAGGTYAMYQIEFNILADTGGPGATDTTRLTFGGLGSKAWGELTLGRQYTHTFHTFAVGSASGYGTFTSAYNAMGAQGTNILTRASNSVKYSSPNMGGFSVGALWAPGEDTTPGSSSNGNYMDVAVRFTPGPFGVSASWARGTVEALGVENETDQMQITGNWDNRAFGIYGGYIQAENDGIGGAPATVDRSTWWINPVMRFGGRHELYFLYAMGAQGTNILTRASNSVKYSSPNMGGFSVGALWAPGEDTTPGSSSNGNYMDVAVRFTPGPFGVSASWARGTVEALGVENETDQMQITGNWDNRAFGIYGGYIQAENDGIGGAPATTDRTTWWINPVMRFGGRHELYFLYAMGENEAVDDAESNAIAITYQHVMSKRTRIYTSIGRVDNDPGATGGLNAQVTTGTTPGYNPRGFQLGLLHSF